MDIARLIVQDGGQIRAASLVEEGATTLERGVGGTLTVNASDLVEVSGSGILGSTAVPSALITDAEGTSPAGNLIINETADGNLSVIVRDGAEISASSVSSTGGNILFNNPGAVLLRTGGRINAEAGLAQGAGDGGNITLFLPDGFVIAVPTENSDIIANAFEGNGGEINITARNIIGLEFREELTPFSDITASSRFGESGQVTLETPDIDPSQGLIELPVNLVDQSNQIDQRCLADSGQGQSAFVVTGRGGVPPSPSEVVRSETLGLVDLATYGETHPVVSAIETDFDTSISKGSAVSSSRIVEAQTWIVNSAGEIELIAQAPNVASRPITNSPCLVEK